MKRLYITLTVLLTSFIANAQSCPDDNHPHAIDLGLPSGTKWACCNMGTNTPEGYGGYYAWGETEEKEIYDWTSYIQYDTLMGTCHDIGSDIAGTEYDAPHVYWGSFWVMPSQGQIQELISKCSYIWKTENGVGGGLFTGPSGGTIFLPAADIRWDGFLECFISGGYYWSSTQSTVSNDAYQLCFDSGGAGCGGNNRSHGQTIRPVIRRTNKITHPQSSTDDTSQAFYNLYGIKIADTLADMNAQSPGIYIVNGRKVVK